MSGGHLSKDFFELVKRIGESRSKQEEDQIILREKAVLKQAVAAKGVSSKKMKEFLIRMLYVEMLGHDASFAHIHAVKMVSQRDLLEKRVGYLACSLVLHADHEFMLLMVNSLQQDLQSDNFLEVSMALTVVAKLVNADLVPVIQPLVVRLLDHAQSNIRKKAVVVLHRFLRLAPDSAREVSERVRKVLCDKDPSVMGASLLVFLDLAAENPAQYKDLVPSFVSILKQVTEHRLPRDYDYHRIPAPWIQINLLRILALLGTADKGASEGMYEILGETMKRADVGINVGYAIVYETVRTITTIYPDNSLIEAAARCVSRFVAAENHNLKYLGINALAAIVQIDPKHAVQHQMLVIDCLEDPDETLKHKTLDLLYSMTNPANVTVIVQRLTDFLDAATDKFIRTDLVARITQLAEKFSPSTEWYIDTMNVVFELGGDLVRPEVAHSLMRIVSEGADEEAAAAGEQDIRHHAVATYLEILEKERLPAVLEQVVAWVLGEFGVSTALVPTGELLDRLCDALERSHAGADTRAWYLDAVMKVCAQAGAGVPPRVAALVQKYQESFYVDLQQRAHEFAELAKEPNTMRSVLPANVSHLEVDVDEALSFLNEYVGQALAAGASPYSPPDDLGEDEKIGAGAHAHHEPGAGIKWQEYDQPDPYAGGGGGGGGGGGAGGAGMDAPAPDAGPAPAASLSSALRQNSRAKKKWGPSAAAAAEPEQEPAPAEAGHQYGAPAEPEPASSYHAEPQSRAAAEPRRRSLTEKEMAAQSLFAGIGGGAGGGGGAAPVSIRRGGARKQARRPAAAAAAPAAAPVAPAKPVDILGADLLNMGLDDAAPAPAPAGDLDLLGDAFGAPAPQAAAQPQQQPQAGGLLDFFDAAPAPAEPQYFLEPAVMDTPAYGGMWKKLRGEVRVSVRPSSCLAPADFMQRVSQQLRVHPVQTIGQEMICAGTVAGTQTLVLVHGAIRQGGVDVIVRSTDAAAAAEARGQVERLLA